MRGQAGADVPDQAEGGDWAVEGFGDLGLGQGSLRAGVDAGEVRHRRRAARCAGPRPRGLPGAARSCPARCRRPGVPVGCQRLGGGQGGLGFDGSLGEPACGQVHPRAEDRRDRLGRDALQLVVAGRRRMPSACSIRRRSTRVAASASSGWAWRASADTRAAACRVTQALQCLADLALVPADHGAGEASRRDDLVTVVAGGGEDGARQAAGRRLGGHPGQCPELRDYRLVAEIAGELGPGQDEARPRRRRPGPGRWCRAPGPGRPRPGSSTAAAAGPARRADPAACPPGRPRRELRPRRPAGRRAGSPEGSAPAPAPPDRLLYARRRQGLRRPGPVRPARRDHGVRGLEQLPAASARVRPVQQDLRVLACIAYGQAAGSSRRRRSGPARPEREGVVAGVTIPAPSPPEPRAAAWPGPRRACQRHLPAGTTIQYGRGRQQLPGPAAEAFQPLMDRTNDPLRQVRGDQHGVTVGRPGRRRRPAGHRPARSAATGSLRHPAQGQQVQTGRRAERVGRRPPPRRHRAGPG